MNVEEKKEDKEEGWGGEKEERGETEERQVMVKSSKTKRERDREYNEIKLIKEIKGNKRKYHRWNSLPRENPRQEKIRGPTD